MSLSSLDAVWTVAVPFIEWNPVMMTLSVFRGRVDFLVVRLWALGGMVGGWLLGCGCRLVWGWDVGAGLWKSFSSWLGVLVAMWSELSV